MSTLFISDLHLDADHEQLTQLFLNFLQTHAITIDALYILGDLFELWLGDDLQTPYSQKITQALFDYARSGIPIYLMSGNRDFLLSHAFAKQSGCILLPDPIVIDLYGEPVLLTHGDSLCTKDKNHQRFRKWCHNAIIQKCFLALPGKLRHKIGTSIRNRSHSHSGRLTTEMMDITPELIPELLHKHATRCLIHGHTHRPAIKYFSFDQEFACQIVLSDWEKQGNYLICKPDGTKRLVYFD